MGQRRSNLGQLTAPLLNEQSVRETPEHTGWPTISAFRRSNPGRSHLRQGEAHARLELVDF